MSKICVLCKDTYPIDAFYDPNGKYSKYVYAKCITCRSSNIKRFICEVCGKKAAFNYSSISYGIRCSAHKGENMVNVVRDMCIKCNKVQANFNKEGETKGLYCFKCKNEDMINIHGKKCITCRTLTPNFNHAGEKTGLYCSKCKLDGMIDICSKRCIKCKQGYPVFNHIDKPTPEYCGNCKDSNMVNKKAINCRKCNVVQPSYNYPGEKKAIYCKECREAGMIDIINKKCKKCNIKIPSYNKPGEIVAICCADCKDDDMIDVVHSLCITCKRVRANYNLLNQKGALYCASCKTDNMVNKYSKLCIKCNKCHPSYNVKGSTKKLYCSHCKDEDMVAIGKKCITCGVNNAHYNYNGQKPPLYCKTCKNDEMLTTTQIKCTKCKLSVAFYNKEGETKRLYCSKCKEDDMINIVTDVLCIKCKKSHATYNKEGERKKKYCAKCKEPDMVRINQIICEELHCKRYAYYGNPGGKIQYCSAHKKSGMLNRPRKKCVGSEEDECKENAIYGTKIPIHCEEHKLDNELNLVERACVKCNKIDILNMEGLCINFCNLDKKYSLLKKRVKQEESIIKNLLQKSIDIECMYTDSVVDKDCTRKRPDFVYHCGSHIIIIEVDEYQHKSYSCTAYGDTLEGRIKGERIRMYEIAQSFDGLPVTFIRYNPNNYKVNGILIKKPQEARHDILVKWIKKLISESYDGLQVKYLFYDNFIESDLSMSKIMESDVV